MTLPQLSEEPFWTYRGVAASIDRLKRRVGGLLPSHDYEVFRSGRSAYPDRKTIRQLLGAGGREYVDLVPPPSASPWTRAEDVYLLTYAHRRPIRHLAWRLGRSPRSVRRRLRRIRIDCIQGFVQPHDLDLILGLGRGTTRRIYEEAQLRGVTRLGLPESQLPRLAAHLLDHRPEAIEHARDLIEPRGVRLRRHLRYWANTILYVADDFLAR